jgi:hyperosmotically inducible protein
MNTIKNKVLAIAAAVLMASSSAWAAPLVPGESNSDRQKIEKIRKELVTLPYYGVFDNLSYKVEGGTVTLYGQVVRPITRSEAARRGALIPGVARVVNSIEVLPPSTLDDEIRVRAYYAVFGAGGLYRYAAGANPSVHIIVDRGRLTRWKAWWTAGPVRTSRASRLGASQESSP